MYVNVPVSESSKKQIEAQESSWNAPKMMLFGAIFLGFCLFALYSLANLTEWLAIAKP